MPGKLLISKILIFTPLIFLIILASCGGGGGDGNGNESDVTQGTVTLPFDPAITSIQIESPGSSCKTDKTGGFKMSDGDLTDPYLAAATINDVPVAYSIFVPGSDSYIISCRETAVTLVMMNTMLLTLPPSLIAEARDLVRSVLRDDFPDLESQICSELSENPQALLTTSEEVLEDIAYAAGLVNEELDLMGVSE